MPPPLVGPEPQLLVGVNGICGINHLSSMAVTPIGPSGSRPLKCRALRVAPELSRAAALLLLQLDLLGSVFTPNFDVAKFAPQRPPVAAAIPSSSGRRPISRSPGAPLGPWGPGATRGAARCGPWRLHGRCWRLRWQVSADARSYPPEQGLRELGHGGARPAAPRRPLPVLSAPDPLAPPAACRWD